MEFMSADRTRDAEYSSQLRDYNQQVQLYNQSLTKQRGEVRDEGEQLKEEAGSDANTNAIKQAGQHANSIKQGVETAMNINKIGKPIKATEKIVKTAEDGSRILIKKGDIIGKETAQTLGKSAGKLATGLGIVGDVGSIGLDIAEDVNNWDKMSTMDKITNIADIGGAGFDMIGTGLMTFGGPVGAMVGLGMKGLGDLVQVGAGAEQTISSYEDASDKQDDIDKDTDKQVKDLGDDKTEQAGAPSLAGAGRLAVGRTAQ
jgi:hypothetical protein